MKTFVFILCLGLFQTASADAFDDANAAIQNGDHKTALDLMKPLAEQGDAHAQSNLGALYTTGEGIAKDYDEAVKWLRKAAEQGVPAAQFNLGMMYLNGEGVTQDYVQAHAWFYLASQWIDMASESRAWLSERMTPDQIAEARSLAQKWAGYNKE